MSNNKVPKLNKITKIPKTPKQTLNDKISKKIKKNETQQLANLFDRQEIRVPIAFTSIKKDVYWPFDATLDDDKAKGLLNS